MINQLIKYQLRQTAQGPLRRFVENAAQGAEIQQKLLRHVLKTNAPTTFGRKYSFEQLGNVAEFQDAVPVHTYEDLRPAIERQAKTGSLELTLEPPVFYTQTSGTTAKPKIIPVTQSAIQRYQRDQRLAAAGQFLAAPALFNGKVLAITSAAVEGNLSSGIPYGSMSGLLYKSLPWILRRKYVASASDISDYQARYQQIAKLAQAERNVSAIATANPSTILKLLQVMERDTFAELWPNLSAVVTWTAGSCGVLLPRLQAALPPTTRLIELGYLSSEFRGSLTIDGDNSSLLTYHENFYEFVKREAWENGQLQFLTMENLKVGQQYYIFATTQQGLYRYAIDDIVEVTGYEQAVPTIRFVQKGKGITNLTGEKLYESQLVTAINQLSEAHQTSAAFYLMLGNPKTLAYTLYLDAPTPLVETMQQEIDARLSAQNIEFAAKRESDRLRPTVVKPVRSGCFEAFKQHCLAKGQREAQFKFLKLQYWDTCSFNFEPWVLS